MDDGPRATSDEDGGEVGRGRGNRDDDGSDGGDGDRPGRGTTSTSEKAVMVISALFTVVLFAYAGWQIATTPEATAPQVSVVGTIDLERTVRDALDTPAATLIHARLAGDFTVPVQRAIWRAVEKAIADEPHRNDGTIA